MSEHPAAEFARTCFNRDGGITLCINWDGKSPKWDLPEDRFWILAESVSETARKLIQSRRLRVVERPAFAEELQPPCDV